MRTIAISREIQSPASVVWRLISEFAQWPRWGPTVRTVTSESDAVADGVTGTVVTPLGLAVPFEITEVQPGVSWKWRVGGVHATGHRVEPTGDDSCRLELSVPWMFAPYAIVLYLGVRRVECLAESQIG